MLFDYTQEEILEDWLSMDYIVMDVEINQYVYTKKGLENIERTGAFLLNPERQANEILELELLKLHKPGALNDLLNKMHDMGYKAGLADGEMKYRPEPPKTIEQKQLRFGVDPVVITREDLVRLGFR